MINGQFIYGRRAPLGIWIGEPYRVCYFHWCYTVNAGLSPTLRIDGATMRMNQSWQEYTSPPLPTFMSRQELTERLQSIVGTLIVTDRTLNSNGRFRWGDLAVGGYVNRPDSVWVDLYLYDRYNQAAWIVFDLRFSCSDGRPWVQAITTGQPATYSDLILRQLVLGDIPINLNEALANMRFRDATGISYVCPVITVDSAGNVTFTPQ